jgi:hypothetical protein
MEFAILLIMLVADAKSWLISWIVYVKSLKVNGRDYLKPTLCEFTILRYDANDTKTTMVVRFRKFCGLF